MKNNQIVAFLKEALEEATKQGTYETGYRVLKISVGSLLKALEKGDE